MQNYSFETISPSMEEKLRQFVPLPDDEWEYCKQHLSLVELKKGDFLVRPGDPSNYFAYIYRGMVKRYLTTPEGNEIISTFDAEGRLVSDFAAMLQNIPANMTIEALEDCVVLASEVGLLKRLLDRNPIWQNVLFKLTQIRYVEETNRVRQLLSLTARDHYLEFLDKYRSLHSRIPQKDVARFLGVTPTSLNRVIRQLSEE